VLAPLFLLSVSTAGNPSNQIIRRIMSDFIKSQMDTRNNLIAQAREVLDLAQAEARGLSAEENQKIARIEADIDQADTAISTARSIADREARATEASASFAPSTNSTANNDADILRSIAMGEMRGYEFARENRTLVPSANTVGQSFYSQVFEIAQLVGPMLTVSDVLNTQSGENLVIPTVTATSTSGSVAAGGTISESNPTFSSITLGAEKYGALSQIASELVTDAGFNITSYIAQQLGTSLGLQANSVLTAKLSAAAGSVVTGGTGVGGAATYENLIDLVYGIADGARVLPNLGFQMSKSGIAAARKLKDGAGNYIWTDSAVPGQPATLLGYPVFENPNVAAVGTGTKSVLFGHLPSFVVRVAGGIRVDQSADYAFNTDTVTYRGLIRLDGGLTHATHIGYFKGGAS
jgi:HK97 family phage major capsid protein